MILYTKPDCEKCEDIKKVLESNGIAFLAKDTKDPAVIKELRPKLSGLNNPILPILEFDDGTIVSNNMGLYKTLREKGMVRK
ncbi:MAG: NrdH-redoxin [Candidatus Margulisbacteria bacterium]|nr:NrdH-redoxin [Candidatus Margulisiibacteriota bacterium]